jgi:hypothetical protein
MPDWRGIVRNNLRGLQVCSLQLAEQIIEELAGDLEDRYEGHLRAGLTESAASQRTLDELELGRRNWLALRLLKEYTMTGFTRKVGLPGLVTFAVAMAFAWALDLAHIQPKTVFLSNGLFLSLPIAWFCLLPFCGALGAFMSRRSVGSRLDGMLAAAFPAAILSLVLCVIFVAGGVVAIFTRDSGWNWGLAVPGLAVWLASHAVLSAISLWLGAIIVEKVSGSDSTQIGKTRA